MENENLKTRGLNQCACVAIFSAMLLILFMWWPKYIGSEFERSRLDIAKRMKEHIPGAASVNVIHLWDASKLSYRTIVAMKGSGSNHLSEGDLRDSYFEALHENKVLWIYSKINDPVFRVNWK